jgi:uroporphyrinogen decarboxylase
VTSSTPFIDALNGKRSSHTPIWLMRQAGRYLPEYRKLRERFGMLEMVMTPELAAEVTLQPLKRFELDAGIIFADILTPLIGMGADLAFKQGEGPVISNPIRTHADVDALKVPKPEENVAYTLDAIKLVVKELSGKTPLIGFSGAPFTLSCYLIEGQSPGDLSTTKGIMFREPEVWHSLQRKLVPLVADYLVAQAEAGCSALQIFDSWLGYLGPREYQEFVEPYLTEIVDSVRSRVATPLVFFSTGSCGLFGLLGKLNVSAFGVDWRISLPQAAGMLPRPLPLQGNLDPQLMTGPWERIEHSAKAILTEARSLPAHIFNLGHGVLPGVPVENVERLIALVRTYKE